MKTLPDHQYFKNRIFDIATPEEFSQLALELFRYQAQHNPVYANYLEHLGRKIDSIQLLTDIPFIPIEFFKNFELTTTRFKAQTVFISSGTSGKNTSRHWVRDVGWYQQVFKRAFEQFYGRPENYCILGLLPSYLEREGSSLIFMVEKLIEESGDRESGFYLDEYHVLLPLIDKKLKSGKKVLLLGVTFALLDLAEEQQLPWEELMVMETGGMKGRRKEMVRNDVHAKLQQAFGVPQVHSEYGMTELLSQAYAKREGLFETPPWMQVMIRETADPFTYAPLGKTGGINIIDLANVDSCAFIETQDLGRKHKDGRFEVMGRFDHADIRGCNLMVV